MTHPGSNMLWSDTFQYKYSLIDCRDIELIS